MHQQLGAEVHVLTKRAFASVVEPNPHVERVFSFEKDVDEVLPALRAERYDWVIDLHHNLRSLRVKLALGRPARSFDKLNLEKWLLVNTGLDWLPHTHIVHRYMATVAHLGVKYDGQGLDYFIPPDQEIHPADLDPRLAEGNYVAFVLGATHATKRLPPEKIADICARIDRPIVLLGGKAEMAAAEALTADGAADGGRWTADGGRRTVDGGRETGWPSAVRRPPSIVNACGRCSLHQSASLVRQAAVVLTHDTGLMHIAAALRKPIVSVWGSTVPKFGMYPLYPDGMDMNTSLEVSGLSCRPCSKIGYDRCPKGHFRCMVEIDVEQVVEAVEQC